MHDETVSLLADDRRPSLAGWVIAPLWVTLSASICGPLWIVGHLARGIGTNFCNAGTYLSRGFRIAALWMENALQ